MSILAKRALGTLNGWIKQVLLRPFFVLVARTLVWAPFSDKILSFIARARFPAKASIVARLKMPQLRSNYEIDGIQFNLDLSVLADRWVRFQLYEFLDLRYVQSLIRPGDICLDIGANIGIYSLYMGNKGAEVHAFEPNKRMHAAFCKNLRLNPKFNIEVYSEAVSNEKGEMKLFVYSENFGSCLNLNGVNSGSLSEVGTCEKVLVVKKIALDDFIKLKGFSCVRLAKIDIDGSELDLVKGAQQTLSKGIIDYLIVEYSQDIADILGYDLDAFIAIFTQFGYVLKPNQALNKLRKGSLRGIPTVNLFFVSPKLCG